MEIDRVEEWRRLKDQYAAMSDGELEAIANDGWELTDVAQQALQGEISSRSLKVQLKAAPSPAPEPADAAAGLGSRRSGAAGRATGLRPL
jgi:hypothetical protein